MSVTHRQNLVPCCGQSCECHPGLRPSDEIGHRERQMPCYSPQKPVATSGTPEPDKRVSKKMLLYKFYYDGMLYSPIPNSVYFATIAAHLTENLVKPLIVLV